MADIVDMAKVQIDRAEFPVDWTEVKGEYAFQNIPIGVLYQFGTQPVQFIPGVHINWIEPWGDADFPKAGFYWEAIPPTIINLDEIQLDSCATHPVAGIQVNPGDWAKGDHIPLKVTGDF